MSRLDIQVLRRVAWTALAVFVIAISATAQTPSSKSKDSGGDAQKSQDAQRWILERFAEGKPADLCAFQKRSPGECKEEEYQVVPGDFLRDLASRPYNDKGARLNKIVISHATFADDVTIYNTDVPVDLELRYCRFNKPVDFSQTSFKNLILDNSHFDDKVSFSYSKIVGNLSIQYGVFKSADAVDFRNMNAVGGLVLTAAQFAGNAWLQGGQLGGIDMKAAQFTNPKGTVNFQNVSVVRDILLVGIIKRPTVFETAVRFDGARVGGIIQGNNYTLFNNSDEPPRFDDVKTTTVMLSIYSFRDHPDFVGMTYENIQTWEDDSDGEKLAALLDQAQYRTDVYARAVDFLRKTGRASAATRVFFHQKARERATLPWYSKLWSKFLRIFVGYGRQPWLAFIWWFAIVALGVAVFFKQEWMSLADKKETGQERNRYYNPFWYSLDLFAPIINLGLAKTWEPGPNHKCPRVARQYAYVHKILGWILIPIALATVTGYLK